MKRGFIGLYTMICTLLLAAGFLSVFYFSWQAGIGATAMGIGGLVTGVVLAPIVHELGHLFFGKTVGMDCVYVKCFCFRIAMKDGKKSFSFASPFAPDQTQVLPKYSGNMKKRAALYTLGGLIFSGVFFALLLAGSVLISIVQKPSFFLWGSCVYVGYLFLLNAVPAQYGEGKTDMLIYLGIRREEDAEQTMLAAMEIQGFLAEGKSFSEIEERYYYDLPVLCEDEPMFAVMLDLRYRYHLEKEEYEKAADSINRLASIQAYLSDEEVEKIAAELVYLHSLEGNLPLAEESGKICREFLSSTLVTAKRILLAYSLAAGKREALDPLFAQAEAALRLERIQGIEKFERILIDRIKRSANGE